MNKYQKSRLPALCSGVVSIVKQCLLLLVAIEEERQPWVTQVGSTSIVMSTLSFIPRCMNASSECHLPFNSIQACAKLPSQVRPEKSTQACNPFESVQSHPIQRSTNLLSLSQSCVFLSAYRLIMQWIQLTLSARVCSDKNSISCSDQSKTRKSL